MGDDGGGRGGGRNKVDAKVRGQVGLTRKEQNRRATMQEPVRGGRRAGGGVSRSAASENAYSSRRGDDESGRFVTSTEGAYRDLDNRVREGQFSERVRNLPNIIGATATALNNLGKYSAGKVRSGLDAGGIPVFDSVGRIQGVVSREKTPFGEADVYSGRTEFNPLGTGVRASNIGGLGKTGYVMDEKAVSSAERVMGGSDDKTPSVGSGTTSATATDVTGSTTSLSRAASRRIAGAAGGASRRQFI